MRRRLVWAIGAWRVRREGREDAELAHPFWDGVVARLMGGKPYWLRPLGDGIDPQGGAAAMLRAADVFSGNEKEGR